MGSAQSSDLVPVTPERQNADVVGNEVERHPGDGWPVLSFATEQAFEAWLEAHHTDQPGVWVKFARKGRGISSIDMSQALNVALCFGWIDSKLHNYDDDHYLLRYQPRRPKSRWSARNQHLAERLVMEGRMRPSGLAEMAAAKANGRWDG